MLSFFQKHEKITLAFVAVIVLLFFGSSFFSGQSAHSQSHENHTVYADALYDTSISVEEMRVMKAFLKTDSADVNSSNKIVNIFNNGVIRHDFMETEVGEVLFQKAPLCAQEEFNQLVKSHRSFRPYTHPHSPAISAHLIWTIRAPGISAGLKELSTVATKPISEQFATVATLYRHQRNFPPQMLAEYLMHIEQQFGADKRDKNLRYKSLALFGAEDITGWFGVGFLEQACLFIHNTALLAEKEGHRLSLEEVKQDLMNEGMRFIKERGNHGGSDYDVEESWQGMLRQLGVSEKAALTCWKKVMLFRRKLSEKGEVILLDSLMFNDFNKASNLKAKLDQIQIADDFRFTSLHSLIGFALYCDTLYEDHTLFGYPQKTSPYETIKQHSPQFLETAFDVEISGVTFDELMTEIPLKEIKGAVLENHYYEPLTEAFSFLEKELTSREERFLAIEALQSAQKKQVNDFIKQQLFDATFDTLIKRLDKKRGFTKEIVFVDGRLVTPLEGVDANGELFLPFLKSMLYDDKIPVIENYLGGANLYTEDHKHYYQIVDCKQIREDELMSFSRMKSLDLINAMVDQDTKAFYEREKKKNKACYRDEEGSWQSLEQAKNELLMTKWRDLLNKLERSGEGVVERDQAETNPDRLYPKLAFIDLMRWAHDNFDQSALVEVLENKRREILSSDKLDKNETHAFSMTPGALSEIAATVETFPSFFSLVEIGVEGGAPSAMMEKSKQFLRKEGQRAFVATFADELESKGLFTPATSSL